MTIYILMVLALSQGSGATTPMVVEFNTPRACQEALEHLQKSKPEFVRPIGCFKKG